MRSVLECHPHPLRIHCLTGPCIWTPAASAASSGMSECFVRGHFQITEAPLHQLLVLSGELAHLNPKVFGHFIIHFHWALVLNLWDPITTITLMHLKCKRGE